MIKIPYCENFNVIRCSMLFQYFINLLWSLFYLYFIVPHQSRVPEEDSWSKNSPIRHSSSRLLSRTDEDGSDNTDVKINAWFGLAGTISPLHYDPEHNLLSQVRTTSYTLIHNCIVCSVLVYLQF